MNAILSRSKKLLIFIIFFIQLSIQGFSQGTYVVSENGLSSPVLLGTLGNRLLFTNKLNGSNKLWISDGSENGTFQIGAINQESVNLITVENEVAYFLEKIDGIYKISTLNVGENQLVPRFSSSQFISKVISWNGNLYLIKRSETVFSADDLIKLNTINFNAEILFTSEFGGIRGLGATDKEVMFIACMEDGKMLGKTDGTASNTQLFHKLYDGGSEFGTHIFMESSGNKMFFAYHPENDPYNLWVSDGTSSGTFILKDYDQDYDSAPSGQFAKLNGKFYYILRKANAPGGFTYDLHVSDGTISGTETIRLISDKYLDPRYLTVFNNKIYFCGRNYYYSLYSTGGNSATTKIEIPITTYGFGGDYDFNSVYPIAKYDNKLVMSVSNRKYGNELYSFDGNEVRLMADINPGELNSNPSQFTQVGDRLFFTATISKTEKLYAYDPNYVIIDCGDFKIDTIEVQDQSDYKRGNLNIVVSGGITPYKYELKDNPDASKLDNYFYNLSSGTYTVIVTDNKGCTVEKEVYIDKFTCKHFKFDSISITNETNNNLGDITIVVSGAEAPYLYKRDDYQFSSNNTFSELTSGEYHIFAIDNNRCSIDTLVNIQKITDVNCMFLLNDFNVFPNPVYSNILTIQVDLLEDAMQGKIEIYSISGQKVFEEEKLLPKGNTKLQFALDALSTGEYLLILKSSNRIISSKKLNVVR